VLMSSKYRADERLMDAGGMVRYAPDGPIRSPMGEGARAIIADAARGSLVRHAAIKPDYGYLSIGVWTVDLEGARFWRTFWLSSFQMVRVEGRFVPDDGGEFKIIVSETAFGVR
jgi:hypothetical protein